MTKVIETFDSLATTPSLRHSKFQLLFSQLNVKSFRRALGLFRDEIYWKLGKTNINSQLHLVPGGLDKKRIKAIVEINPKFSDVRYRRMTINLWEFEL